MLAFARMLGLPILCASIINPETGKVRTTSAGPDGLAAMVAKLADANAQGWNVYFQPNTPPRLFEGSERPGKADIAFFDFAHVDSDPRKGEPRDAARERILAMSAPDVPPESILIDSGNGYQRLWRMKTPLRLADEKEGEERKVRIAEEAERTNRALCDRFDGDNCFDVSRLLRFPGSVNWPSKSKRERGYEPRLSRVVHFDPSRLYTRDELPKAEPLGASAAPKADAPTDAPFPAPLPDVDALGPGVPDTLKAAIASGPLDPDKFPSRSEYVLWATCELVRLNVPDESILSALTTPGFKLAESVLDKRNGAERYARRQLERARAFVASASLEFQEHEGKKVPNQHNARVFLQREGVRVAYDEFADRFTLEGLTGFGPALDDKATIRLRLLADSKHALRVAKEPWADFLTDLALYDRFHPVRDYLDSLAWDGVPRVDGWLVTYGGAEDGEYVRAVGALVLVAAVRRVMEPGCKFDEMLVLEGPQGKNKSSALAALAVREEWFTDDLPLDADAKRFIEAVKGKWIVEAGELKGMRKGEVDALKSALSRRVDRARLAYGRHPVELPRQCVIIGSTNSDRYLKDATGNRRFWPVRCGEFNVDALRRDRDQLWAEARVREARGESIRLAPRLYPDAGEAQEARRLSDPFEEALEAHLAGRVGKLRAHDVWVIVGKADVGRRTQDDMSRLGEALRRLGWERTKRRFGGPAPEWCYVRGSKAEREEALFVDADPETGDVRSVGPIPNYRAEEVSP
jgi:hypothetical protein